MGFLYDLDPHSQKPQVTARNQRAARILRSAGNSVYWHQTNDEKYGWPLLGPAFFISGYFSFCPEDSGISCSPTEGAMISRYVAVASLLLLTGCGVTTPEYLAPDPSPMDETSITVNQSYDGTWDQLIQYTSQRFFAIDNYEKESGLMTLTFSFASDPGRFVDCGHIQTDGPPSFNGEYVDYIRRHASGSLDGRMNLTVQERGSQTEVSVNVRYVVSASNQRQSVSWTFNTGGSDTIVVPANNFGAQQERTCRPTHEVEKVILEGITDKEL